MSNQTQAQGANFWDTAVAVTLKDLRSELRSKETVTAMAILALLIVVIFNFAVELRMQLANETASGFLWVAVVFSGMFGLERSLAREKDRGSLEGLLLCPIERGAIFVGKLTSNLVFIIAVEVIILPLFWILFDMPVFEWRFLVALTLGSLGFAGVGTLLAAMAIHTHSRDVIFPILLMPATIPLVLASVRAGRAAMNLIPIEQYPTWIGLLLAFDLVMLTIALLTFPLLLED